jgi:DnaJ domain
MFERGNKAQGALRPSVKIVLSDGREVNGSLIGSSGRTLSEVLNSPSTFLEFEPMGEPVAFLAKSDVRSVLPMNVTPPPRLPSPSDETLNPFAILGVPADANREELHRAYLELAKIYHPDKYVTTGLPVEVREYLASMARRINAAYEAAQRKSPMEEIPTSTG